jgi:antitoxin component of MazEF toxin-antitoxin module
MTIPDPLVRELDLHPGDDLNFDFDDEDGTLYIGKKTRVWEAPDWLQD